MIGTDVMINKKGPLDGLIIIDLSRVLAGPYCTMVLSDLGARVIKVEPPNGDDSRNFGPFKNGVSTYFLSLNRGKESIELNLKKKKDKDIFLKLIKESDVLVENYRPGTMERLKLGYKMLQKINPKLIYASCSGFGYTGPWNNKPAYDVIVQALGGIMSLTGTEGAEPIRVGSSIGDIIAGLFTSIGIQSALINRYKTKKGSFIDISMLDCQIAILENAVSRYFAEKKVPLKLGSRHPSICPFEAFRCKDDFIVIAAGNDNLFKKLCECIGSNLHKNKVFLTNSLRLDSADLLKKYLEEILINHNAVTWIKKIEKAGVPVGKVNNIKEALELQQIKERNMIVNVKDKKNNLFKVAGNPIKINNFKDPSSRAQSPELDEDRKKILKEFKI